MNRHSVDFLALVTQSVKPPTAVETHSAVNYNLAVSKGFLALTYALVAIVASGCPKKNPAKDETGAVNAADRAGSAAAVQNGPVDETPLQGIDASKLATDKQKLFYKLVGS